MGQDLHAYLEYYDKEYGIWEGLAHVWFPRDRVLHSLLLALANGMPKFDMTRFIVAPTTMSLEVWAAWLEDNSRLGIHHEGHMTHMELRDLRKKYYLETSQDLVQLDVCLDMMRSFEYGPETHKAKVTRFVYWFDN